MSDEEFKSGEFQGTVLQKLKTLEVGQTTMLEAMNTFKEKMGERVGGNEKSIESLNGRMEVVLWIGKWIFGPVFSIFGIAILASALWWLTRK